MSSLRPNTLGIASWSLHLFSMRGLTAADGPLGQKTCDLETFMGATSCNCLRKSLADEYLISVCFFVLFGIKRERKRERMSDVKEVINTV